MTAYIVQLCPKLWRATPYRNVVFGRLVKPLEKVSIVPLPTEKYPLARIELFQQFKSFNKKPMSSKEIEQVVTRALVNQDKHNHLAWLLGKEDKTTEAKTLEQEVRQAIKEFNVCCELLPHALLVWPMSSNLKRVLRNGLAELQELRILFSSKTSPARKDFEKLLRKRFLNLRRVKKAVTRACLK